MYSFREHSRCPSFVLDLKSRMAVAAFNIQFPSPHIEPPQATLEQLLPLLNATSYNDMINSSYTARLVDGEPVLPLPTLPDCEGYVNTQIDGYRCLPEREKYH